MITASIESLIEQAIADGIAANLTAFASEEPNLSAVQVNGFFLASAAGSGDTPNKRRDSYTGPRINLTASPNIPGGYQSAARSVDLTIDCITQPDSDPDRTLCRAMYFCARKVFDDRAFTLPDAAVAEIRGYLITGSSAGVTDAGMTVSLTVTVKVFVKQ